MVERSALNNHGVFAELRILLVYSVHEPHLTRSLTRDGHDVLTVDDGVRAGRLLRVFRPDVLVLYMQDVDILRRLRSENPDVVLVAVVPDDVADQRVAALNAGADDCLSEPVHDAELRARIRVAARTRSHDWEQPRQADVGRAP